MEGYQLVAEALKANGIKYMFGIVGIPVVEVAMAAQQVCQTHRFSDPEQFHEFFPRSELIMSE